MPFKDHFSTQADRYLEFRPRYPRALFEFLATLPAQTARAWDCGTGNGQAAVELAEHFDDVVATDSSARQIAHAVPHPRVRYVVSAAEQSPLADQSVDLVAVAQALHWFDLGPFYAEVRRVARPGAIIAAWGYEMATVSPKVDRVVGHFYSDVVGPYWPPERRMVETRYAHLAFPFREPSAPDFATTTRWNLDQMMGYLGTWSSVQQYIAQNAADPLDQVRADLAAAWGSPGRLREITWPVFVRIGHLEDRAAGN